MEVMATFRTLRCRAHPRFVDKTLGRGIDGTSFAASRGEYVQRALLPCTFSSRQGDLVIDRLLVIGEQVFGPEDAFEIEQAAEKVGLTAHQLTGNNPRYFHQSSKADVFTVKGLLGGHQFVVKLREREPGRQHRMLNVV